MEPVEPQEIWEKVRPRLWAYLAHKHDIGLIQEFADGPTPDTVGGWLVNSHPPTGLRLVALWHLLDALGLESEELDKLPPYNRFLGQLMTFGRVFDQALLDAVRVKNPQTLIRILRGQAPMNPRLTLEQLQAEYGERVRRTLEEEIYPHRLQLSVSQPVHPAEEPPTGSFDAILQLSSLISAALPLARYATSAQVNPEQRSRLRELVGQENIASFLHNIVALQSEKALKGRR